MLERHRQCGRGVRGGDEGGGGASWGVGDGGDGGAGFRGGGGQAPKPAGTLGAQMVEAWWNRLECWRLVVCCGDARWEDVGGGGRRGGGGGGGGDGPELNHGGGGGHEPVSTPGVLLSGSPPVK